MTLPAFTAPLTSTSFLSSTSARSQPQTCPAKAPRSTIRMQFFRNPFAKKPTQQDQNPSSAFMEPQPGDPGYKPKAVVKPAEKPAAKPEAKAEAKDSGAKSTATKLPVSSDDKKSKKRGLDLLRQDFLVNAPTIAGVGRQDVKSVTMKPVAGEPGYKPESYQTVKVSSLGISPFSDDKNYVSKVGGVEAVKQAAIDVTKGKSASQIKKEVLKEETKSEEKKVYDIPDYLKPLPEDTPRKGLTWVNYIGR